MFRQLSFILRAVVAATLAAALPVAEAQQADPIIALERGALDRWGRGDPEGYLELYARDITYFDPVSERRIDDLDAMRKMYAPIKGLIKVDRYEMIAPHVSRAGDTAVLTYNLISHGRAGNGAPRITRWNSTVVYVRRGGRWQILHSHWSYTKPELKTPAGP
jgi:ketosteroid isomerase-like protein